MRTSTAKLALVCQTCGKQFIRYRSNVRCKNPACSRDCVLQRGLIIHGMSHHPIYGAWLGMRTRCHNPKSPAFAYYGGRGIVVCDEWRASFLVFRDWALQNGWDLGLELDRINVNGPYAPTNCRWVTRSQQMSNTRKRSNARTSQFKGVSWCANVAKWRTQIQCEQRHYDVGLFRSEIKAAMAYDEHAIRLFGEYAHLNFPRKEGVPS